VATVSAANETELVTRAQSGQRNAFSELVRIHAPGVVSVIYRMCGDMQIAEDAAQETFVQAWVHLLSYRPGTSLRNWLYRIAVNTATDILRREKRILPTAIEDFRLEDPQPGPEAIFSRAEQATRVQNAILSLPEASRAVLILREYEELSYHEIANTLDIPVGTVMSRLNYARTLLRNRLERQLLLQVEVENV
jgi:RNA polymerase sigma-70 factor, ECF subfamily